MAGSSATITSHFNTGPVRRIVVDCVGDSADGTIPNVTLPAFNGRLIQLVTNPGSTGPSANYDITVTDQEGADRLAGCGNNRHTSNSELAAIVFATSLNPVVSIGDTLTQVIANTSVNNATVKIVYYYLPL